MLSIPILMDSGKGHVSASKYKVHLEAHILPSIHESIYLLREVTCKETMVKSSFRA
jgi:hypothetical protein